MSLETFTLNTGTIIPAIGFGTWKIKPDQAAQQATAAALNAGYRHVDTARIYRNEEGVGEAIRASSLPRQDIFVTTKLWNLNQGYDRAHRAFDKSLKRLGLDYVDLYLLHWPVKSKRLESWRALEEIHAAGRARAIGVSNFTVRHLTELMENSSVVPAVNQIELHPFLYKEQIEVLEFCAKHGIVVEAYSPLAHGQKTDKIVLPPIAQKHGKTVTQVILRWCLQRGTLPLPKSTNPVHIAENLEIFDFELLAGEMQAIDTLSDGTRTCWNPNRIS